MAPPCVPREPSPSESSHTRPLSMGAWNFDTLPAAAIRGSPRERLPVPVVRLVSVDWLQHGIGVRVCRGHVVLVDRAAVLEVW